MKLPPDRQNLLVLLLNFPTEFIPTTSLVGDSTLDMATLEGTAGGTAVVVGDKDDDNVWSVGSCSFDLPAFLCRDSSDSSSPDVL
jgi:hypothetical protein